MNAWAAKFRSQEPEASFFLACVRFHFASALSMVAFGTAITERNNLSNERACSGASHLARMSAGIDAGSEIDAFIGSIIPRTARD